MKVLPACVVRFCDMCHATSLALLSLTEHFDPHEPRTSLAAGVSTEVGCAGNCFPIIRSLLVLAAILCATIHVVQRLALVLEGLMLLRCITVARVYCSSTRRLGLAVWLLLILVRCIPQKHNHVVECFSTSSISACFCSRRRPCHLVFEARRQSAAFAHHEHCFGFLGVR